MTELHGMVGNPTAWLAIQPAQGDPQETMNDVAKRTSPGSMATGGTTRFPLRGPASPHTSR